MDKKHYNIVYMFDIVIKVSNFNVRIWLNKIFHYKPK